MAATSGRTAAEVADDLARGFAPLLELVTSRPCMDATLLDLCRVRIAGLLGCESECRVGAPLPDWAVSENDVLAEVGRGTSSERLDHRQRAALQYAQQFLFDAKNLTSHVEDLLRWFTDEEVFVLTVAFGLFESHYRRLLVQAQLAAVDANSTTPGSTS